MSIDKPGGLLPVEYCYRPDKVCVLPDDLDKKCLAKADCFTMRPTGVIDREYLALQLASPHTYELLASDVHGDTRPRVNTAQVRSLPIPLCSLEEQRVIVRKAHRLLDAANRLFSRIDSASRQAEHSAQVVLTKVFRGEFAGIGGTS